MSTKGRTSVTVLITLAELAWLAAFALLFAYRSKIGELGVLRREVAAATGGANESRTENERIRKQLAELERALEGVPLEEIKRRLGVVSEVEKQLAAGQEREKELQRAMAEKTDTEAKLNAKLKAAKTELAKLQAQFDALPPNIAEIAQQLKRAQGRVAEVENQLDRAETESRRREEGEFSIRRELTGLPDGDLRRVVFLVDTSTSMRNSSAWDAARNLMRSWLEFLPVEECALVNFNDEATGFPSEGYHRVRRADGVKLSEKRDELLRVFDNARAGTYTDLLRALQKAYAYPSPDVIVLFSDGQPRVRYRSDKSLTRDVLAEVAARPRIPILTVALGSYEVEGAGGPNVRTNAPIAFLKELAQRTGGGFLAR